MKSELFFEALPVRTPEVEEPGSSASPAFISILVLLIVAGGIVFCWKQSSAGWLALQTEEERVEDELSLSEGNREASFGLRVSSVSDFLCFRSTAGEIHRVNYSAIGVEEMQMNLFPGRYSGEFQISPVADQMAVSFMDKSVVLQSLDPSLSTQTLLEQTPEVIDCLAYSTDGRLLAGASLKGLVLVWDVESGQRIAVLRRANDQITSLVFDSELGLLVGFESGVERWVIHPDQKSRDRRQLDWKFPPHQIVREMLVSPEGRYLVTASFSGVLSVWDLARREKLWEQSRPSNTVRGLVVSEDSKSVYCFTDEKALREYDLLTGTERFVYRDPQMGSGTGSGFSRQGDLIYSGCTDGFIRIWSPEQHLLLGKIDTALL